MPPSSRQTMAWTIAYLGGTFGGAFLLCAWAWYLVAQDDEGFSPGGFVLGMAFMAVTGAICGFFTVALAHLATWLVGRIWWSRERRTLQQNHQSKWER